MIEWCMTSRLVKVKRCSGLREKVNCAKSFVGTISGTKKAGVWFLAKSGRKFLETLSKKVSAASLYKGGLSGTVRKTGRCVGNTAFLKTAMEGGGIIAGSVSTIRTATSATGCTRFTCCARGTAGM
jgi:hypothetical protein